MQNVQVDPAILYVQKLNYFMFLSTLALLGFGVMLWRFGLMIGLWMLIFSLALSYLAMMRKKTFTPPQKRLAARRMARDISQDTSPLSVSRFASQLYYYFHEPALAISLLEKFLPTHDPLLCTTLCDILIKEGKFRRVLYIIRDNPHALIDPLMLATQGIVLLKINKISESIRLFERSLHIAKKYGFPDNGSFWITQKFLSLGYRALIHHTLADCYMCLGNPQDAKRHYRAGNLLLFDISLWRQPLPVLASSTENYNNSC